MLYNDSNTAVRQAWIASVRPIDRRDRVLSSLSRVFTLLGAGLLLAVMVKFDIIVALFVGAS